MRTALASSVSGIARMAPIGPMITAQNSTENNVTVWLSETAWPTTRGWTIDCTTALMTA